MSVDYRPEYDPADVDNDYGHTGGDITVPTFTANMKPFRFWCQKALPLVYDDSLSYYEVLCKMADYMNNFMTDLTTVEDSMTEFGQQFVINQQFLNDMADQLGQNVADLEAYINDRMTDFMGAYTQLQDYVNNYFDNLDVQQEINNKLDEMASDGTLNDLFDPVLETWMQQKTAQIDSAIANQDAIQAAQNGRISVLEGRMDTFSGLPSGSTSGNAELLDIRTNFLGETYPTAGDAVRASDMIASGFQSISASKLEEWDGNKNSSVFDTIQIDISGYKGGHVAVIGSFLYFQSDLNNMGSCSVYATNTPGKVEDANAVNCFPGGNNSIFTNFTQLQTSISGEERLLLQFAIPDNFSYQYLKIGHLDHSPNEGTYTEPLYIVYANSWSKTQVDPTLEIAGDAADAKATGDAIDELNERLDNSVRVKVSPDKTTFFEGTENLFNANDPEVTTTGYYNRSNTLVSDRYIRTTGYIPVIPGEKYVSATFGIAQFILWFTQDNSDGFSSFTNLSTADTYVTVPDGIYYAKFTFDRRNVFTFGVYHASTAQTYTPYNPQIKRDYLKTVFPVQPDELSIISPTVNLFNPNDPDVLIGQYYDRTNTLQSASTLGQSGYIPVEPLKNYAFSHNTTGFALWYASDKTFLAYSDYTASNVYVTALSNAYFMRLIFVVANEGSFSVNAGETLAPYEAYHTPIIKSQYLPDAVSSFDGLTGVAFGTSLTYRAQTTGGFLQYLPGLSGITFDNQGLGSSTILSNGTQPEMLPVITGYTGYSGKRVCLLEGFCNDWYYNASSLGTWKDTDQTTVCGCVRYALNYILTQNPDLTVFLILDHFGKGISAPSAVNSAGQTQLEFYQEIEKVALSMGIRVIREYELSEINNLTPQYLLDNIHLNTLGAEQSAYAIWSGMKNTYPNILGD